MCILSLEPPLRPAGLLAAILFSLLTAQSSQADIAVVTLPATTIEAMDAEQLRALWLGTINRIDGVKLKIADRSDDELRDSFYSLALDRTRGEMKALRAKRGFQLGVPPPPAFPDDRTVLEWVRGGVNRVGYIDASAVDETVKVLFVLPTPKEGGS